MPSPFIKIVLDADKVIIVDVTAPVKHRPKEPLEYRIGERRNINIGPLDLDRRRTAGDIRVVCVLGREEAASHSAVGFIDIGPIVDPEVIISSVAAQGALLYRKLRGVIKIFRKRLSGGILRNDPSHKETRRPQEDRPEAMRPKAQEVQSKDTADASSHNSMSRSYEQKLWKRQTWNRVRRIEKRRVIS